MKWKITTLVLLYSGVITLTYNNPDFATFIISVSNVLFFLLGVQMAAEELE